MLTSVTPRVAHGALGTTGKWTQDVDWRGANNAWAIHLVLMPGDGPPHSRVLFWSTTTGTAFYGREWAWNPTADLCGAFPSGSFTEISVPGTNVGGQGDDLFCAGQTLLDGDPVKLFLPGGTEPVTGAYGENKVRIFTPGSGSASGTWSDPGEMNSYRWYPTTVPLRDGRAIVLSGDSHPFHRVYGGLRDEATPASPEGDSLYRFAPIAGGDWDKPQLPAVLGGESNRPPPREGHTLTSRISKFDGEILFGGRNSSGVPMNDTYTLLGSSNITGPAGTNVWRKENPNGTVPDERTEHVAVGALDTMMVMFGGLGDNGEARSDLHRLYRDEGVLTWDEMEEVSGGPSARYGHTAVYDESGSRKRMIVFGGTTPGNAPADLGVWELRFTAGGA